MDARDVTRYIDELSKATTEPEGAEHRSAMERLAASEERFRLISENTSDGLMVFDHGEISYVSPAYKSLVGYGLDEEIPATATAIRDLVHPDDADRVLGEMERAFAAKERTLTYAYRGRQRDGTYRWREDSATFIYDENGTHVRSYIVARDIDERKRAEDAAHEANRAKSEFLAAMSHELRTPLNGIIGFTDLLMRTELDTTQREYLNNVWTSAETLLTLINDVLDLSKIEAGRLELENTPTDLHRLLEDVIDLVRYRAHEKGLEILLSVAPNTPRRVLVDGIRLKQVLVNLLSNAIKFTDSGEVELAVKTATDSGDPASSNVAFSVRDTGLGIPADKQERIFNAFTQADLSTTRSYGGTGLGLTISNRILAAMGDTIRVESEPGVGSTFSFTLNLESLDEPTRLAESAASAPESVPEAAPASPSTRSVVVVEPNRRAREIISDIVADLNAAATIVATLDAAWEALRSAVAASTDLLLINDAIGYTEIGAFLERARRLLSPTLAATRVVIMSDGIAGTPTEERILKPVTASKLSRLLRNVGGDTAAADAFAEDDATGSTGNNGNTAAGTAGTAAPENAAAENASETTLRRGSDGFFNAAEVGSRDDAVPLSETPIPGMTVLIAEDDRMNMVLTRTIVRQTFPTARVVEATDGVEAVQRFKEMKPDFVFMDVQMPKRDGYEATREIRRYERTQGVDPTAHIPIIALTAGVVKGERRRCLEAGMDDFVSKPVDIATMRGIILRYTRLSVEPAPSAVETDESAPAVFNRADLLDRIHGNESLVAQFVDLFQREAEEKIAGLKQGLDTAEPNWDSVRGYAHKISGVARTMSMERLTEAAFLVERAILEHADETEIRDHIRTTLAAYDEVLRVLAAEYP